ncbi:MAG: hypothetical protein HC820_10040 [Hydrococcus sp. RM1_1_31]|nr:hypothetical protein [Hydrococcus sp. RM1_1_31]
MYKKVWQTEKLIDDNDYGVVVFYGNSVIANVNLQLRRENSPLKSEKFFQFKHWQEYLKVADSEIAEISGLAISDDIPNSLSRPVLMTLVLGLKILLQGLKLKAYTTIQHKFLIRLLAKSLGLPFFMNETVTTVQTNVPDDNYWKRAESPRVYYLDGFAPQAIQACDRFFDYFKSAGIQTIFNSRIVREKIGYSQLFKSHLAKNCQVLQVA